jgi:hypothetical protein
MNPVQPVHHAHRPWTPKEDKAIRRLYPSKGSAMAESIGRTQQATQRRASTLGVQLSDKARSAKNTRVISVDLGGPKITADLVEWAGKLADRYAARYGDPDGRYGPAASEALATLFRSKRGEATGSRKIGLVSKKALPRLGPPRTRRFATNHQVLESVLTIMQ